MLLKNRNEAFVLLCDITCSFFNDMALLFQSEKIQVRQINQCDPVYLQVLAIRNVILTQPLRGDLFQQDLSEETNDIVLIAEVKNKNTIFASNTISPVAESESATSIVVGCLMLREYDEITFKLRQMAVIPEARGQNIGKLLVGQAEILSKSIGKKRIHIHSRLTSIGFYEKLGYKVKSDKFDENGLLYVAMDKILLL